MKNYITEEIFKDTQCDFSSLRAFGFSCSADFYSYAEDILDGQFKLLVRISKRGNVEAKLIETQFGEEYSLHLVEEARGELVNRVRKAYRALLEKIASRCFKKSVFKSASALRRSFTLSAIAFPPTVPVFFLSLYSIFFFVSYQF